MQIITTPTPLNQLWSAREIEFEEMMKIVVDVEQEILAIDGEMHADLEQLLLVSGLKAGQKTHSFHHATGLYRLRR